MKFSEIRWQTTAYGMTTDTSQFSFTYTPTQKQGCFSFLLLLCTHPECDACELLLKYVYLSFHSVGVLSTILGTIAYKDLEVTPSLLLLPTSFLLLHLSSVQVGRYTWPYSEYVGIPFLEFLKDYFVKSQLTPGPGRVIYLWED